MPLAIGEISKGAPRAHTRQALSLRSWPQTRLSREHARALQAYSSNAELLQLYYMYADHASHEAADDGEWA